MGLRLAGLGIITSATVFATSLAGPIPPGRQHLLTINGENTITFIPQMNRPEFKVDYQVKVEYIVDSRYGKEPKTASTEEKDQAKDDDSTEKPAVKTTAPANSKKSKSKKAAENPSLKATGAIEVSLHSTERLIRENGNPIVEMKANRSKIQGKLGPELPVINVGVNDAPLRLQEIMKGFDVISASILLNDDLKAVNRKYRNEGPQRALTETILSIHAPLPRNADSWESPTQLVMGQGQTAKGTLRFEKIKPSVAVKEDKDKDQDKNKDKDKDKESPLVKVKVSGVLRAEGVVAGQFVKNGTYTVTGEQTFDTKTHDWITSRWSVVVDNELSNPAGQNVARARGKLIVESKALDVPAQAPGGPEKGTSKL
jgi:hypothetical protein